MHEGNVGSILIDAADHDDAGVWVTLPYGSQCLQSTHHGHFDIQKNEIRRSLRQPIERHGAVRGGAHDSAVRQGIHDAPQDATIDDSIVDNKYA